MTINKNGIFYTDRIYEPSSLMPRYLYTSLLTTIFSGTLFYFSTGFNTLWFLLWVAPIPLLVWAHRHSALMTSWVAFLAFMLGQCSQAAYLKTLLPAYLFFAATIVGSIAFTLVILLSRHIMRRSNTVTSLVVFPALWVSYEYLASLVSTGGALESLVYNQLHFTLFIQIVDLTGIWGAMFCVFLFSSAISGTILFTQKQRALCLSVAVLTLLVPCGYGFYKIKTNHPEQQLEIALIAIDKPLVAYNNKALELANGYAHAIANLSTDKTRFVLIPEKVLRVKPDVLAQIDQQFRALATQKNVDIIVGIERRGLKSFNSAKVYRGNNAPILTYNKHHLLPGAERHISPGTDYLAQHEDLNWGVAICKDMDFTQFGQAYGQRNIQLLLVPGFDFSVDEYSHAYSAIMRGVENGYSIARSANWGLLLVSDPFGRILASQSSAPSNINAPSVLHVTIPIYSITTFYSKQGDWFAWMMLLFVLLIIIKALNPIKNIRCLRS